MNKKYSWILFGFAILTMAVMSAIYLTKSSSSVKGRSRLNASTQQTTNSTLDEKNRTLSDQTELDQVRFDSSIVITKLEEPPKKPATASILEANPVNGTLQIRDSRGNLLIGTPNDPVFDMKVSPSEKLVILTRGDGVNQIYSLSPFALLVELPRVPDMPRASAFDNWQWLDENKLVGVVYISKKPELLNNLTGAERESPDSTIERTLLFTYDLKTGQTGLVNTKGSGLPSFFSATEIWQGGCVVANWVENDEEHNLWLSLRSKAP